MNLDDLSYYEQYYRGLAKKLDTPAFHVLRSAIASVALMLLHPAPDALALSIGCGDGKLEFLMAPTVGQVIAFDQSLSGLEIGAAYAHRNSIDNVVFGSADASDIPLASGSCDMVWAFSLLHHLQPWQRQRALAEFCRVLKPGGALLTYDPSLWRLVRLARVFVQEQYQAYHSPDEVELHPLAIQAECRSVGFSQIALHFFDLFIDPLTWLFPNMPLPILHALLRLDRLLVRWTPFRWVGSNFFLVCTK